LQFNHKKILQRHFKCVRVKKYSEMAFFLMQFFTVLYLYFLQIYVLNIRWGPFKGSFISSFGAMESMQTSNKKTWMLNLNFNCRFLKTWFSFSSLPLSWHRSRFRYVACFFATCLNLFSNRSYINNINSNLFFRCHRNERGGG
jgi:hypothetical protein